jgi:Cu(I)/Ag(I) efflux system periplasmic protein CusF
MKFARIVLASTAAVLTWAAAAALPLVDAEVRKVDPAGGTIVLRHKDIPNLGMSGMTMQFDVANRKMLDGVKPGDKVRFSADIVGGKPTVTELRPAK